MFCGNTNQFAAFWTQLTLKRMTCCSLQFPAFASLCPVGLLQNTDMASCERNMLYNYYHEVDIRLLNGSLSCSFVLMRGILSL